MSQTQDRTAIAARLAGATDEFIASLLPDWLKRASPAQINRLRDRFAQHRISQQHLRGATLDLMPLDAFARSHLSPLLEGRLPPGVALDDLQWLDIRREFGRLPGSLWPFYAPVGVRQPGLLRLMQNFHPDDSVLVGSGLVVDGTDTVLSGEPLAFATACRRLDLGRQYQTQLAQVFSPATAKLLADDKRAGLSLAIEVAALKGAINAVEQIALQEIAGASRDANQQGLRGYPGLLTVLGHHTCDAMVIQFRGTDGEDQGLVLYLPSDPLHALQRFDSWQHMALALVAQLRRPAYLHSFSQLIAIEERPAFLQRLGKRLADPLPDLALEGVTVQGDIFAHLVARQIQRIEDDARLLLVPTADANAQARKARLQAWESAGLGLVNLAGLFIPGVGALLLGLLVVQTLSEVYEGAVDWLEGHQHEALEHLLGVAETLAVTTAVAAGASIVARGFARSTFVDGLEPVQLADGRARLWSHDLDTYAVRADDSTLQADGLYGEGDRRRLRDQDRYHQVHRPQPEGPWRLRHPYRDDAYGPVVHFNGERSWLLLHHRPLEWRDEVRMLERLWPHQPPLDAVRVAQVLQVSRMDAEAVRGVLVERRPLPVNLRETLRRFDADARTQAFFASVQGQAQVQGDARIQAWCLAQPGLAGLDAAALREQLREQAPRLRVRLFEHLSAVELPDGDALLEAIRRDFPGLPPAYALQAIDEATPEQRSLAIAESRVPLEIAQRAAGLLRLARLNRALEGLFLINSVNDETGNLIIALLRRLPNWPISVNLILREGSENGRLMAMLDPQGAEHNRRVLFQRDGRVQVRDSQGRELGLEIAEPGGFFETLVALLSPAQLSRLAVESGEGLRQAIIGQLPASTQGLETLLGWPARTPWFNPGQRLPDGRVGYALSGRGQRQTPSAASVLFDRVRQLYPSFSDLEVTDYVEQLSSTSAPAMTLLLRQEQAYQDLDQALSNWQSAELDRSRSGLRGQMADILRRCWRFEGTHLQRQPGAPAQMRLDVSGYPARTLPALPVDVDFGHVSELVLNGLQLDNVLATFLRPFGAVRRLTLNGNRLLRLPTAIAYLTSLETLRLAHNSIRLDEAALAVLAGLPRLVNLDLSYNPLGTIHLRFNQLSHLVELHLRHCRLAIWPFGLELCAALEHVDLRNNEIPALPDDIMQMPLTYRRAFMLDHNPLPSRDIVSLYSVHDSDRLHAISAAESSVSHAQNSQLDAWLQTEDGPLRASRSERWNTLQAMPHSAGLFELLSELRGTADYESSRAYLTEQVWTVLDALDADPELREQIFLGVQNTGTCADGIAERFSTLQMQVLVARTERASALHERGSHLIELGRQLFRLEQLEQFARRDIAQRVREGRGVDEIEVILFYRVELAEELELPLQPRAMRYGTVAVVTEAQLADARQAVRAAETDEALAQSLSQRDFWQRYLRERHPAAFDAIDQDYAARGTQLDQEGEQLNSQVYAERWDLLRTDRASASQGLSLELTRERLLQDRTPPG